MTASGNVPRVAGGTLQCRLVSYLRGAQPVTTGFDSDAMKNRRLYAILLLAALALLQARVAFAGCFSPERAMTQAATGCCTEHGLPDGASHGLDEPGMTCASHCVKSSDTTNDPDTLTLAGAELVVSPPPPLLRSALYPPSAASLRLAHNEAAHPPHTSLIYVLQRLLI